MSGQPPPRSDVATFEAEVWRWVRQNFARIEAKSEPSAKDLNAVRNLVLIGGALRGLGTERVPTSSDNREPAGEQGPSEELASMLAAIREPDKT